MINFDNANEELTMLNDEEFEPGMTFVDEDGDFYIIGDETDEFGDLWCTDLKTGVMYSIVDLEKEKLIEITVDKVELL